MSVACRIISGGKSELVVRTQVASCYYLDQRYLGISSVAATEYLSLLFYASQLLNPGKTTQ